MNLSIFLDFASQNGVKFYVKDGNLFAHSTAAKGKAWIKNQTEKIRAYKTKIIATLQGNKSWGWKVTFPDRPPVEVYYSPEASIEQVQHDHPDAASIAPYAPPTQSPAAPMTAEEETAIRAWLAHIEETDPALIAETIERCQQDEDARAYFVWRAESFEERAAIKEFDGGLSRNQAERETVKEASHVV
jgi:hypothetical protein